MKELNSIPPITTCIIILVTASCWMVDIYSTLLRTFFYEDFINLCLDTENPLFRNLETTKNLNNFLSLPSVFDPGPFWPEFPFNFFLLQFSLRHLSSLTGWWNWNVALSGSGDFKWSHPHYGRYCCLNPMFTQSAQQLQRSDVFTNYLTITEKIVFYIIFNKYYFYM